MTTTQENKDTKKPFKMHLRGNGLVLHKKVDLETVGKILQIIGYYQKIEDLKND